jgi:hypothetical protein
VRFAALLLALLLPCLVPLGMAQDKKEGGIKPLPTDNDAWTLAAQDLAPVPDHEKPYFRYIWVESGKTEDLQVCSLTANQSLNRSSLIIRPVPVFVDTPDRGRILLAKIDLRSYAPQQDEFRQRDLDELIEYYEELANDPRFNIILTRDGLRFLEVLANGNTDHYVHVRKSGWHLVDCEPYPVNNVTYTKKWVHGKSTRQAMKVKEIMASKHDDITLVRFTSPHIDHRAVNSLVSGTRSLAPVVSLRYFNYRALATIKDEGVSDIFSTLLGGLYYDFAGIRRNFRKGTDFDNLLERLGIGNVEQGINFQAVFNKFRSDQKFAKFHSDVTDGPRGGAIMPILVGRVDQSQRLIRITFDLKRANIDHAVHPIENLNQHKFDASEVYWNKSNGLLDTAAFDGKGKLQDEVPFDVAKDYTQSPPRHGRLQARISCAACHEAKGDSRGFMVVDNDAKKLLKARLEIFGDLTDTRRSQADVFDRLLGSYAGDPEIAFRRARDDYARAVLQATGPSKESKESQADVVQIMTSRQVQMWRDYDGTVDTQEAVREMGFEVDKESAVRVLNRLIPPGKEGVIYNGVLQSPKIIGLKTGIPLTRTDFALIQGPMAAMAKQTMDLMKAKEKK